MNNAATSKDQLLAVCLELASSEGLQSLNMRSVAQKAGVSVGCVYNYFPTKADLLAAAVERIWQEIFRDTQQSGRQSFFDTVRDIYRCINSGSQKYPSFLALHALAFSGTEKSEGRAVMEQYLGKIRERLLRALAADPTVRPQAFDETLTREALVGFVFEELLTLGSRRAPDCELLLSLLQKALC